MNVATLLKLAAWGVIVAVALQVVFHFVFQIIGYNSNMLSITLLISLAAAFLLMAGWKVLKRTVK